ncbi:MAG: hypothetical protein LBK73_16530 [Treponema sp.]|nr:hypothetical protein [Treponema sp.]
MFVTGEYVLNIKRQAFSLAKMLFITGKKMQTGAEFFQLPPLRLYRMYPTHKLATPFIMALWGLKI